MVWSGLGQVAKTVAWGELNAGYVRKLVWGSFGLVLRPRLSPTMECIFEYPYVRMPSLCPWIAACKYYALQRKTQTERQTRETVGWRAFTRGKCIFPRSDAFTAAPGVGAGVAAAREPGGAGSFRASSTPSPRRPESRSRLVGQNGMHLIYAKN